MPDQDQTSRIEQQLKFLVEADKLKSVLRASPLCDGSRRENSGEHSWHLALYAMILAEHSKKPINTNRVIKMLLIHDRVEIDAGDQPLHENHDPKGQIETERKAAERIYGLLPNDQAVEFRTLWDEFEAAESDDAVFAKSIDRVQPVIANLESDGGTWAQYEVKLEQLKRRVGEKVRRGAPAIWAVISGRIESWFKMNPSK